MKKIITCVFFILMLSSVIKAQELSDDPKKIHDPESVVFELYDLVTFKAGETPDWDKVRSLFLKEAVIVLRSTRDSSSILTLEGFVEDFIRFIENSPVKKTGFIEKIIKSESFIFGDIAHFLVVYEVTIPETKFKPQIGVDSFHLIRTKEGWKISSIVNEVPSEKNPLPDRLKD